MLINPVIEKGSNVAVRTAKAKKWRVKHDAYGKRIKTETFKRSCYNFNNKFSWNLKGAKNQQK